MATSGRVKGWRELLASNNIIPVAFDRQNTQSEINTPFNLNIKVVDGVIPQVISPYSTSMPVFCER